MKKILAIFLVLALVIGAFSACGGSIGNKEPEAEKEETNAPEVEAPEDTPSKGDGKPRELNLYTWEGMFPDEVLRGFTEETGIKINFANFDTDEAMLAKLQADTHGSYDLVIADDYIIKTAIAEGLVLPLDKGKITNYGNIDPRYQQQFYDPSDEYTVPYGSGVQTIVYNPAEIDMEITSYADLWDPSLEGQIGIIGNYRVINGMALKVMGESYNTEDVDVIAAAGVELNKLAPNIRTITDDNLQDKLLTGEINVGVMYTSQVTAAKIRNPELIVVFPTEGIGFGIMANFIPVNAPNPDAAYEFIDYILRPDVAAECMEFLGYYSTNEAANALISPEYVEFLTLPEGFNQEMEMIQPVGAAAEDAHSLVWTEFQATR